MRNKILPTVLLCLLYATTMTAQVWTAKKDFADGLTACAFSFVINDTMYVGGAGDSKLFRYDAKGDSWLVVSTTPATAGSRENAIAFTVGNKGYMALGADSIGTKKDLWEYTPATNTWAQKADFPGGVREFATCFTVKGKAYVGGGLDTNAFTPGRFNDLWEYDPATDHWQRKADMPYPNSSVLMPYAFASDSLGYISCGEIDSLAGSVGDIKLPTRTYAYSPVTNTWTPKADFPSLGRLAGTAFVLNGNAYCGFGDLLGDTDFHDMYLYDFSKDTWTMLPASPMGPRAYLLSGVTGSKVYIGTGLNQPFLPRGYYQDWWEFSFPESVLTIDTTLRVAVYPDPVTDNLFISNQSQYTGAAYTIYDMAGQLVNTGVVNGSIGISTSKIPAGAYLLTIDAQGKIGSCRFVKQ